MVTIRILMDFCNQNLIVTLPKSGLIQQSKHLSKTGTCISAISYFLGYSAFSKNFSSEKKNATWSQFYSFMELCYIYLNTFWENKEKWIKSWIETDTIKTTCKVLQVWKIFVALHRLLLMQRKKMEMNHFMNMNNALVPSHLEWSDIPNVYKNWVIKELSQYP